MHTSNASSEKLAALDDSPPLEDLDAVGTRVVVFDRQDPGEIHEEKVHHGHLRPKGVEMKREMTKEDKELAAAGYEHLEERKVKAKPGDTDGLNNVDITEHKLAFDELQKVLDTHIDTKDPGASVGLTSEEAKARLARDGPNVLTPPKKKSALRKVCGHTSVLNALLNPVDTVLRLSSDDVQHSVDYRRYPRVRTIGD